MPLLGPKEKGELEKMVYERLVAHWNAHGSNGLLAPGMSIVLEASGASIEPSAPPGALASVEIRTLFTALCHLSAGGPGSLPRDNLESLATEATSSLAAQVNRLVPD